SSSDSNWGRSKRWRHKHFSYFKTLGIPGPEPSLLWGNIREYHETDHIEVLDRWLEKYGDTFGFFDGDVPFIVTKDLDFLEFVFVRNFQNFTDRGLLLTLEKNHPRLANGIVYADGMQWRNLRRTIASGFTPMKLKQMMTELGKSADIFVDIVQNLADSGKEANVFSLYQHLSLDYVGRAAFGVDYSFQKEPDSSFATAAKAVVKGIMKGPLHMICQSTTMLGPLMKPLCWINMLLGAYVVMPLLNETYQVIELRRKNPKLRKSDVLQNLLDAEYQEEDTAGSTGPVKNGNAAGGMWKSRSLTTDEVLVSAATLFVAGYETTSTSLSYITYLLAKHPEVQERVRKEVNDAVSSNAHMDYETLTWKLPYLGQVINEALRLYPPVVLFVTRKAVTDFEYNGLKYKAGTCIMSPTLQIHRDARYWPQPLTFNPDRFSPENEGRFHKVAHHPFGIGPRNCVGMRMALLQLNCTIARLVQGFRLELGSSQREDFLDIHSCAVVSKPTLGPWVVFRRL
ncbi:cytochrome P450 3A9-like, partial [Amblyomma americanum]